MLISFIVPVYNAEDYIEECVQSLLRQTYEKIEILLINDGSKDRSGSLCDAFAAADRRVRVIHKENGGVHTARNMGISEAKGEYLMFVDADDWIDPVTAERTVEIIEKYQADVVRFTYMRELENGSSKKSNTFVKEGFSEGPECQKVFRQTMGLIGKEWSRPENFNFLATTCTSAYRKDLMIRNEVRFEPREAIGSFEDGLFNLKFIRHADRFYYMDEPFYHYRKTNAESCTANYRVNYLQKQTYLFTQLQQMAAEEADPVLEKAFYNRVVFSNLELCLNVVKSQKSSKEQRAEMKEILNSPIHCDARKYIVLSNYPLKWKVYFFLVKHGMVMPVYFMTKIIRYLQKRGG